MKDIKVKNPITAQDYPDADVIRVEDTYYMISTTMHFMPGGVILRSYDLANWEIAGYVYDTLDDTPAQMLTGDENIYGKGMWAASIRYHKGTFYVCFVANDTQKTYLYTANDVAGPWKKSTIEGFYHDCSLLFDDDDRVYIVYGNRTVYLTELNSELTGPKEGGLHRIIVKDSDETALGYEGAHLYKINGKYYVFFIHSLVGRWYRTEACFMSDSLEGEFVGGDVFEDDMGHRNAGIAQGGIVDTPDGDYYAILFQDRGAVGRIPVLIPMTWENDMPVIGKDKKLVGDVLVKSLRPGYEYEPLYTSDDFSYEPDANGNINLKKQWQWNHNPKNDLWSVTERKNALRLHLGKVCDELTKGYNTLTQRTTETVSEAEITVDASNINDGDYCGISAFIGGYGAIAVTKEDDKYALVMMKKNISRDSSELVMADKVYIDNPIVTLKCVTSYKDEDIATFYYKKDGEWIMLGDEHKLFFRLDHFTGCRFGLFAYATKQTGGYADFMNFVYKVIE